jgi:TnsA endonuclease C terminal
MVPFESALERDQFLQLEFTDAVESYEAQPVEIRYIREGGVLCRGFPDVAVTFRPESGRPDEIQDVKYRAELRDRWTHLKPRLRAACGYARGIGKIYRLRTEVEIRTPFLAQAKFLYRYLLNVKPEEAHVVAFSEALHQTRQATAESLLRACFSGDVQRAMALPTLWNMVATRAIGADLDRPLTMLSNLWALDTAL